MSEVRCPRCGALVHAEADGPLTCPRCGFTKAVKPALLAKSPRRRVARWAIAVAALLVLAGVGAALVLVPQSPLYLGKKAPEGDAALKAAVAGTLALRHDAGQAWSIRLTGVDNETFVGWSPQGPTLARIHNATLDAPGSGIVQRGGVLNVVHPETVLLGRDERAKPQDVGDEVFRTIQRIFEGVRLTAPSAREEVGDRTLTHFVAEGENWTVEAWATERPARLVIFNATGLDGTYDGTVSIGSFAPPTVDDTIEERSPFSFVRNETLAEDETTDDGETLTVITGRIAEGHRFEVKLAEVELRLAPGVDETADEPVATLRLDRGRVSAGGYTVTYTDVDKDGLVSTGDRYEVRRPSERSDLAVFFFDLWAAAYALDETPPV